MTDRIKNWAEMAADCAIDASNATDHDDAMQWIGLSVANALLAIHDTLAAADRYAANEERQREEAAMTTRDEYHTMDELYEYRMLYNALAANAMPDRAVKSWRHSDGEQCFGGGWFVVYLDLPTGQVSNHYKAEHWGLFQVPEADLAPEWDGHTPAEAADRLRRALAQDEAKQREEAEPDPLDEDDHRDRIDRHGDIWQRVHEECWTEPDFPPLSHGPAQCLPLRALPFPLTFAPESPPDGARDDLTASEGESGSVEGEGSHDAPEALLCPECGHDLEDHCEYCCGCPRSPSGVAYTLLADAVKAEREAGTDG